MRAGETPSYYKVYLIYLKFTVLNDVHGDSDFDYNTAYSIYSKSSLYTCPRTISRYVAKSQGRCQHVGWCRSGRKLRLNI